MGKGPLVVLLLLAGACGMAREPTTAPAPGSPPGSTWPSGATWAGDDVVPRSQLPPPGGAPMDVDDLVGAVNAYAAENPDAFAGVMLGAGRVWAGFTGQAEAHLAALRARVQRPHLLAAFTAEYSEQELRALQARITDDMQALRRAGVDVSMVGFDLYRNRVQVGVRDRDHARVHAVLARRYDARMFFVETGVEVRPLRASASPAGPAGRP